MKKTIRGTVSYQDNDIKLEHFLKTRLHLSKNEISRAKFREDGICVNGKRRKTDTLLKTGDLVEILLEDGDKTSENLAVSEKSLSILYEDEDVIVLDKPAGVSVHPAGKKDADTLANRLAFYLRGKREDSAIRIIGRLDKDTSGAVLAAKNRAAATRFERQRKNGSLFKCYLALTEAAPYPPSGRINLPIGTHPRRRDQMCITPDGKTAATRYETLRSNDSCALVQLSLETGRTHQIRVHMAAVGCPLLGDPLYGNGAVSGMKRTALHARGIHFLQPFTGEELLVEAPVPDDMLSYLTAAFPLTDPSLPQLRPAFSSAEYR